MRPAQPGPASVGPHQPRSSCSGKGHAVGRAVLFSWGLSAERKPQGPPASESSSGSVPRASRPALRGEQCVSRRAVSLLSVRTLCSLRACRYLRLGLGAVRRGLAGETSPPSAQRCPEPVCKAWEERGG